MGFQGVAELLLERISGDPLEIADVDLGEDDKHGFRFEADPCLGLIVKWPVEAARIQVDARNLTAHARAVYWAVRPPSIRMVSPLIMAARSLARKVTTE